MLNYKDYSHLFNSPWTIHWHEKDTWDYMKLFLNSECVFFDVGCQKGIFSEGVINSFGNNCKVFGFDVLEHPDIKELERKFSNFKFTNTAVGNGKEIDCMISYDANIFADKQSTIALDDFCSENKINKLDFIKIDVDGGEVSVLEGSQRILQEYSPVLMIEIVNSDEDRKRLRLNNDNKEQCNNILKGYGYNLIEVKNDINYFFKK